MKDEMLVQMNGKWQPSRRQSERVVNRGNSLALCLPWPADRLGVYGSGQFDGSPVSPEALSRAIDAYVAENVEIPDPLRLAGICAGRTENLEPVIVVTCGLKRSHRYEVRAIANADMTELVDECILHTNDPSEAKRCAGEANGQWGAAIVDTLMGTIDWGHAITPWGVPAPEVRS